MIHEIQGALLYRPTKLVNVCWTFIRRAANNKTHTKTDDYSRHLSGKSYSQKGIFLNIDQQSNWKVFIEVKWATCRHEQNRRLLLIISCVCVTKGVAKGWGSPGVWDPQSNLTKIIKDKICAQKLRTTQALHIRLTELNNLQNIVHKTPNQKFWLRPCTWQYSSFVTVFAVPKNQLNVSTRSQISW